MTTPGSQFPVLTPQGEIEWWVVSETSSSNPNGSFIVVSGTQQQIQAKYGATANGPYTTKAAAEAAAATTGGGFPGANIPGSPGAAIGAAASAAASGLSGQILGPLFQSAIWLRVVEVLAGLVLLAIGVNALFKGKPLQVVTSTAGLAGRAVP